MTLKEAVERAPMWLRLAGLAASWFVSAWLGGRAFERTENERALERRDMRARVEALEEEDVRHGRYEDSIRAVIRATTREFRGATEAVGELTEEFRRWFCIHDVEHGRRDVRECR